jgi:hypothetical protein
MGFIINPYRYAVAAPTTDPNFSSVKLLIGADTAITDESPVARTLTANGNAARTTSVSKFGAGSLVFDGSGDYITAPDSADWDFSNTSFTLELFARFVTKTSSQWLLSQYHSSTVNPERAWAWGIDGSGLLKFAKVTATTETTTTFPFTPTLLQWYHLAFDSSLVSTTNTKRLYIDGAMVAKNTDSFNFNNSTVPLNIGRIGSDGTLSAFDFNGNMDEVRITKGVARYNSDGGFTVPTAAYPRS